MVNPSSLVNNTRNVKPALRQLSWFRILVSELSNRSLGFSESDIHVDFPLINCTLFILIISATNNISHPLEFKMVFSVDKHGKETEKINFLTEFSNKIWTRSTLDYLLKKIDTHASVKRLTGNRRPRTTCTANNVGVVETEKSTPNSPYHLSINFNSIGSF